MREKAARMIEIATNDAARGRWIKQQAALSGEPPATVARRWPAEKRKLIKIIPQMMPRDDVPPTPTPTVIPPQPVRPMIRGDSPEPPGVREAIAAAIAQDVA